MSDSQKPFLPNGAMANAYRPKRSGKHVKPTVVSGQNPDQEANSELRPSGLNNSPDNSVGQAQPKESSWQSANTSSDSEARSDKSAGVAAAFGQDQTQLVPSTTGQKPRTALAGASRPRRIIADQDRYQPADETQETGLMPPIKLPDESEAQEATTYLGWGGTEVQTSAEQQVPSSGPETQVLPGPIPDPQAPLISQADGYAYLATQEPISIPPQATWSAEGDEVTEEAGYQEDRRVKRVVLKAALIIIFLLALLIGTVIVFSLHLFSSDGQGTTSTTTTVSTTASSAESDHSNDPSSPARSEAQPSSSSTSSSPATSQSSSPATASTQNQPTASDNATVQESSTTNSPATASTATPSESANSDSETTAESGNE